MTCVVGLSALALRQVLVPGSRVDHRTFLGAADCGWRSAGSKAKDHWGNFDNGQLYGPTKVRQDYRPDAVAVIFHDRHYCMTRQKRSLDLAISLVPLVQNECRGLGQELVTSATDGVKVLGMGRLCF